MLITTFDANHKLSFAVDKYKSETAENVLSRKKNVPEVVNTNPLDALDFNSPDFRGN